MLVDTIDRKAMKHKDGAHPLGITFCKVIVNSNNMHPPARQCVQEHRKRCHKCLTFTGCHLSDLALVQNNTTDKLHIVVHHIPCYCITTCRPCIMINGLIVYYFNKIFFGGKVTVKLHGSYLNGLILLKTPCG